MFSLDKGQYQSVTAFKNFWFFILSWGSVRWFYEGGYCHNCYDHFTCLAVFLAFCLLVASNKMLRNLLVVESTKRRWSEYVDRVLRHCLILHDALFVSSLLKPEYPALENTCVPALHVVLLRHRRSDSWHFGVGGLCLLKLLWLGGCDGPKRLNTDFGL